MCLSHTTEAGSNAPLVLLIEDDASLGSLLVEVLAIEVFDGKRPFYRVEQARTEKAAKAFLSHTPPLLCILEHHPPVMDGLKLYDQICAFYGAEQILALLISNDLPQIELIRRQLSGLQKPFDLECFIRLVREMLALSQQGKGWLSGKQGKAQAHDYSPELRTGGFSLQQAVTDLSRTAARIWSLLVSGGERSLIYQ